MITLMPDVNITRHVGRLAGRMQGESWREFWDYLDLRVVEYLVQIVDRPARHAGRFQ